jgi:DNA-binding transcriptional LysR family regulator
VVAVDHPLARRRRVNIADLADEHWIVRAEHPVREVLHTSALAAGFEPKVSFQANDYQEAQAMVSVGLGVALAPRTAVLNRHPNVRLISLGSTVPARRVLAAHRRGQVDAPAAVAFSDVLLEIGASYSPTEAVTVTE